jgi:hypothetical protein
MPEVNGQYSMNPQLAQAKGDQAATAGDSRTSAELAGYMELDGAQKDADCSGVNVPGGVSSAGGCCNLWDQKPGAGSFTCGTCTKVKGGQAAEANSAGGGDDGSLSQPSSSGSPQSSS